MEFDDDLFNLTQMGAFGGKSQDEKFRKAPELPCNISDQELLELFDEEPREEGTYVNNDGGFLENWDEAVENLNLDVNVPVEYVDGRDDVPLPPPPTETNVWRVLTAQQLSVEYTTLQEYPIWLAYLTDMTSRKKYEKEVADIILDLSSVPLAPAKTEYEHLIDLQQRRHQETVEKKGVLSAKYKATSLLGQLSVLNAFHLYTGKGSLKTHCPILEKNITKWMRGEVIKKAKTLSKDQMAEYYKTPDTDRSVLIKAFVPVALATAGRGGDTTFMEYQSVVRVILEGHPGYKFFYKRGKTSEAIDPEEQYLYITAKMEVDAIDKYLGTFRRDDRIPSGRLWRKLIQSRDGMYASKQVIGKNTIGSFGKEIAIAIGMNEKDACKITGHWVRRTGLTWGAQSGLTAPQLMKLSGHKNIKVCMGYVADSDCSKLLIAQALSINKVETISSPLPPPPPPLPTPPPNQNIHDDFIPLKKPRCENNVYHITLTGNTFNNAPLQLFGLPSAPVE